MWVVLVDVGRGGIGRPNRENGVKYGQSARARTGVIWGRRTREGCSHEEMRRGDLGSCGGFVHRVEEYLLHFGSGGSRRWWRGKRKEDRGVRLSAAAEERPWSRKAFSLQQLTAGECGRGKPMLILNSLFSTARSVLCVVVNHLPLGNQSFLFFLVFLFFSLSIKYLAHDHLAPIVSTLLLS